MSAVIPGGLYKLTLRRINNSPCLNKILISVDLGEDLNVFRIQHCQAVKEVATVKESQEKQQVTDLDTKNIKH